MSDLEKKDLAEVFGELNDDREENPSRRRGRNWSWLKNGSFIFKKDFQKH